MDCLDIRYKIIKDEKLWFSECLDYPVFTQGKTRGEALENLKEAFILYAEDPDSQERYHELKRLAAIPAETQLQRVMLSIPLSLPEILRTYEPLADFVRKGTGQNPL